MTPLEQFDREGWEKRYDDMTDGSKCPYDSIKDAEVWLEERSDEHLLENECYGEPMFDLSRDKIREFIRGEMKIVVREAVEERIAMIREEIRDVAEPYPGAKWLNKLDAEWILTLPSLQLPASDSDTRA